MSHGKNSKSKIITLLILLITFFTLPVISGCSTVTYDREFLNVEDTYYNGQFDQAVEQTRNLATSAGRKNLMLYSMEAGLLFHTMGDIQSSDRALQQADYLAENLSRTKLENVTTFILNDNNRKFIGQNFERVLIKFYLAMNRLIEEDLENAKVYFRNLNYELHEMKYYDSFYKQNAAARYLDAVVSEQTGNFNDARVQYKNLAELFPELKNEMDIARYILSIKENEKTDQILYKSAAKRIPAYNNKGEKVQYHKGMAEVVLINYAGQSAVKSSRGRIAEEPELLGAFQSNLQTQKNKNIQRAMPHIIRILQTAENPIPEYMRRDPIGSQPQEIILNDKIIGETIPFYSYSETAIRNFNDHYDEILERNIGSLSLKISTALTSGGFFQAAAQGLNSAAAAQGKTQQINTDDAYLAGTMLAISELYQTIAPDLRCWRLLPDNYQIYRFFLEPGTYDLSLSANENVKTTWAKENINLKENDIKFITFKSMSNDRKRYRLMK